MAANDVLAIQQTATHPDHARAIWLATILFSALSISAAVTSKGFLEADSCTHYLYARFALSEHHLLTNVWGRPWCTAIYALPAVLFGRPGVRAMSLLLALATAWITWRIARKQGYRYPALAFIFLLAQPLVFLHSFSELTELPFIFLLALGFWAYQSKQWLAMAIIASLMPTARPEGFGFLILAAVALILHRRARWLWVLVVPFLIWNVWGWVQCDMPQPWPRKMLLWIVDHWPYAAESLYQSGPLLFFKRHPNGDVTTSFLLRLPAAVSPFIFPAILIGLWLSFRDEGRSVFTRFFQSDHLKRCQWLIALLPLMIFAGHSYLFWRGKMASSGELRYLMVVAPFWALLAAWGWGWAFERARWKHVYIAAGVAALLPIFANVMYKVIPLPLYREDQRALEVARWYQSSEFPLRYPRIVSGNRSLYYFLDVSPSDWSQSAEWNLETVTQRPPGAILVWDPIFGVFNADATRSVSIAAILANGWVPIHIFEKESGPVGSGAIEKLASRIEKDEVGAWYAFLSPRDIHGRPTPRPASQPTTMPAD